ncbi:MAG: glycoside hydrolase family 38 C-terminal domain-containing protein [Actinomycetota bacterium]|nr:glycoside hydrolase family 38 C-terminal domain-containing protein [Actinomycetota bacterium]
MHDDRALVEARIRRESAERILPATYRASVPFDVEAWHVPGEPVPWAEAQAATYEPFGVGGRWGRPWGTTWFRLTATVPEAWRALGLPLEAVVDLGFDGPGAGFTCEGLVYDGEGVPLQGVHPRRPAVRVEPVGEAITVLVEAAANPSFPTYEPSPLGSLATAGDEPMFTLRRAELAVFDPEAHALLLDVEVLDDLMRSLPLDDPRRARLLATLERAFDTLDLHDVNATAPKARDVLAPALALPARASAHRIVATGHAHIDTAWLWPLRETRRKCARTFASAVRMMDTNPEYRFVCSQAVQYSWIEERHPVLFDRIKAKATAGQWVPVGGMWVEPDMNLPSGESIVRQLVVGQRYFTEHFSEPCREIWIPDVFGYPASLPQVFAAGGCRRFVTQKLSWNRQNRFPHNTFWWEGLDGTRVLTHFPPVDTYNAEVTASELVFSSDNFAEHRWSDWSLMPFGHGNGGGGPTREMVERARRTGDLDGSPRVQLGSPSEFFDAVESEAAAGAAVPVWRGELYFEMHRGTLTSQTATKVGNRTCERLLRDVELWWAAVEAAAGHGDRVAEVRAELGDIWRSVLTLQFHDILPGSSIAWVHADAEATYADLVPRLDALAGEALGLVAPSMAVANAAGHDRDEVVVTPAAAASGPSQRLSDGRAAYRVRVPGQGIAVRDAAAPDDEVAVTGRSMANGSVSIRWDDDGGIESITDLRTGRELVPPGDHAAVLELAPDHPVEYDAWDLEHWARRRSQPVAGADAVEVLDAGPLVGRVRVRRTFGDSTVELTYVLRAGSARFDIELDIDWHESEKLLSLAFPLDVRADTAACEIQFGHVERPTHPSSSWDAAKFEVCAHRWVDVSEPSFGVAVLNDGRYGHALFDGAVRVTLQKASRFPDPDADLGRRHHTTVSVLAHGPGLVDVLAEAENLNVPLRPCAGPADEAPAPVVEVDHPGVGVSAVKTADDGSGDLIVRLYEALGDRATVSVRRGRPVVAAMRCDLLEEPGEPVDVIDDHVELTLRPFELVTLRLS